MSLDLPSSKQGLTPTMHIAAVNPSDLKALACFLLFFEDQKTKSACLQPKITYNS